MDVYFSLSARFHWNMEYVYFIIRGYHLIASKVAITSYGELKSYRLKSFLEYLFPYTIIQ